MSPFLMPKSILIVEDDLSIRANLQEFFEGESYSVVLAGNGQEALDVLTTHSAVLPGLIFLDLMMPVMDGPTFLLELQRIHPEILADVPIFVITAAGDGQHLTIKPRGFLKKPLDLDELSGLAVRYCGVPS